MHAVLPDNYHPLGIAKHLIIFIKRNLSKCLSQVQESVYLTRVRPQLEYASDVWNPHYIGDTMELEKVQ